MGDARRHVLIAGLVVASAGPVGCRGCTGIDDFALEDAAASGVGGNPPSVTGSGGAPGPGQGGDGSPGAGGDGPGNGGSSSAGEGGDCVPCYSGPDGTEGRGICRSGIRCGDGECEGEVVPLPADDCVSDEREDCEAGASPVCTGAPSGHGVITENQESIFQARIPLASDTSGRTVGAATYQSATYFDGTPLTAARPSLVLWGLDADLQPSWKVPRLPPADVSLSARSIAIDGDDVVLATLRSTEDSVFLDVELWQFGLLAPTSTRSFLNPSVLFAIDNQVARGDGRTYVVFTHDGSADLDGDGMADGEATAVMRTLLAALDDTGEIVWSLDPTSASDVAFHSVAVAEGDVWVSGMTIDALDLGCPAMVPAGSAFVAAFADLTGECRVAETVQSIGEVIDLDFMYSLIAASERGVASTFPSITQDVWFHDLDGGLVWSQLLDATLYVQSIAVDGFGHPVVAGSFFDGEGNVAVARKLDREAGEVVWPADVTLTAPPFPSSVQFSGVAARPDGSTVVGGVFTGPQTLEGVAYASADSPSTFYYVLAP